MGALRKNSRLRVASVGGEAGKKRKSAKGGVTRNYFRQESRKSSKTEDI